MARAVSAAEKGMSQSALANRLMGGVRGEVPHFHWRAARKTSGGAPGVLMWPLPWIGRLWGAAEGRFEEAFGEGASPEEITP